MRDGIDELADAARLVKPEVVVWRGDTKLLLSGRGVKVLAHRSTSLRPRVSCEEGPRARHSFPNHPLMCGSTRANFWMRAVALEHTGDFVDRHDARVWRCLCEILGVPVDHDEAQVIATLSSLQGVGPFQCIPFSQCRALGNLCGLHEDDEATATRQC